MNLRYVDRFIARLVVLDPCPLDRARPVPHRLIGCCRDFALLFTAMARHVGIPARLRVGFADYFAFAPDGFWIDHTVAERWTGASSGWRLTDPEQSKALVRENHIRFDPTDVPRGRFITGGEAWHRCRDGSADPVRFCVEPNSEPCGLWFVRSRLLLDLAALNGEELLLWDSWKATAPDIAHDPRMLDRLDSVARLTSRRPPPMAALARLYSRGSWRVPSRVTCFSPVSRPYSETLRRRSRA